MDPTVLVAEAVPTRSSDHFDVRSFGPIASLLVQGTCEHLALSDGLRRIRIDIVTGSLRRGPVSLRFQIPDDDALGIHIRVLRQFRALRADGHFAASLHPPEPRATRWIAQLRVHDAVTADVSEREIAAVLFGEEALRFWREGGDPVRSAVRRLVRAAHHTVDGGYLKLLDGHARVAGVA